MPFVRFGDSRLAFPTRSPRCAELRDFVGREICVGIRPEDFVAATGPGADDSIEVHVTRAESLGSELFVYFQTVGAEASPGSSALSWATRSRPRRSPARR